MRCRAAHLRSAALWAFGMAAIGFGAVFAGLIQYLLDGVVSIRPGRDPLQGATAIEALIVLSLVNAGFLTIGLILRSQAKRDRSVRSGEPSDARS